jgi:hypothetical protein
MFNFPFADDSPQLRAETLQVFDFIVSLNFQHIVREKTIRITAAINAREGYKPIGIYKPSEVLSL